MMMQPRLFLLLLTALLTASNLSAQTLIHYWNFNDVSSTTNLLTPNTTLVSGASITHQAGGISAVVLTGTAADFATAGNLNARNGDAASNHLRFNDPIGGGLIFALPTTGFQDVIIKYAVFRSGSGAGTQIIDYTTDGTSYTNLTSISPATTVSLQTLDFSSISAADNNANFKIRITFAQGGGGTVGNNRFDNFTIEGNSFGADVTAPNVSFTPVNGTINVATNENPTLTFNEDVRLADNSTLDNSTVDAVVEVRLNNASGALVPFDATINDKVITIAPTSALANNQTYYVALLANTVEDVNDNAITSVQSFSFTTIAVQTAFQPGDIVIVAYRMNATSTEDEIALLTFVDILPGTIINFTDGKYTGTQCPGGFTWTAGSNGVAAGTVFTIQTSALVASTGTLSASGGFGLSSTGEQVIIYTGSAASPSYITALSSNAWLATAGICGGAASLLPSTLADGTSSINLSTTPDNVSGNTTNAFYNGTQTGTIAQLRASILDPLNWTGAAAGSAAQTWPAWAFPGPPVISNASVLSSTSIKLVFNRALDNTTATDLANYTGIAGLTGATLSGNEVTLSFSSSFTSATTYTLSVAGVKDNENRTMSSVYTYTFTYNTTIGFTSAFTSVNENAGNLTITLQLTNPSVGSVDLIAKGSPYSSASVADYTYSSGVVNFTGSTNPSVTITIPLVDDAVEEQAEYLVFTLENPVGCSITGATSFTVFIKDNDHTAPVATQEIELSHVSSFEPSAITASTSEIVVHDPSTQRLFIISAIQDRFDIADFSDPANVTLIESVNMAPYGGVTSIAVYNGIVAVASPNANEQLDGSVVFFDTDGNFLKQVTVGALPDMITFTHDGQKVLTANEGQPSVNYSVDPEGSVSVIDISGGIPALTQANVTTLNFTSFNSQEATLRAAGVRKLKLSSTLSQDFEPEYITISADDQKAWVVLQENNAIAEINLQTTSYTSIWALGTKDYSVNGNGFDASDNNNTVAIANWPVKGFYLPDGIANYEAGGITYLVTANEGDEKEYTGFEERATVASLNLDDAAFPNESILKQNHNLGRFRVTNLHGDTDNDGDYDELYAVGSRSFSIFNTVTGILVYDSGDDFEMITSTNSSISSLFNSDHESNALKNRSRAKGPEPESVAVATIEGETYAFVGLERVGGVMVYNITNPAAPEFVDYKNARQLLSYGGDNGPEGIFYISGANSPDGKYYILVANEISGTVSVFEIEGPELVVTGTTSGNTSASFYVYPNPTKENLYFSDRTDYTVTDLSGKVMLQGKNSESMSTTDLPKGMYVLQTANGVSLKFVIE